MTSRRAKGWDSILHGLATVAGSFERTSMYPGAEVIDATYDVANNIILVRGRDGYYEPALTTPGITYANGDLVTILYIDGAEPIALQQAPGSGDPTPDGIPVTNASGAAVSTGSVGYINDDGEFETTATAYLDANWAVVLTGGANGTTVYVARRGLVTVTLNGNCSIGDFLYTSTTAEQAQPLSSVRPQVLAIAQTANTGGAGGTCEALLHTDRKYVPLSSTNDIYRIDNHSDTRFEATINGAPTPTTVVYNAPGVGSEDAIVPSAATQLAKARLWNTTRNSYRLITAVNTGTNTITTVNSVDAWANGDSITIESQTTVSAAAYRFVELDLSQTVEIPALACTLVFESLKQDSGGVAYTLAHPYEAEDPAKAQGNNNPAAGVRDYRTMIVGIIDGVFCWAGDATGAGTCTLDIFKLMGAKVAGP